MIKFVNKEGAKVLELNDNGELNILDNQLKESFNKECIVKDKEGSKNEQ